MVNYLSLINFNNLTEEEIILNFSSLIGKCERAFYVYKSYKMSQEVEKVDNDFYIGKGLSYYQAISIKESFYMDSNNRNLYDRIVKLNRNRSAKKRRCREKLEKMFINYDYVYFMTYQLYDNELKLNDQVQRRKVRNWLKGKSLQFALNVDYGELKERKHFHALFGTNTKISYKSLPSNITLRKVPNKLDDKDRLSKYCTKLSAHAVKLSTKNERITYWCKK